MKTFKKGDTTVTIDGEASLIEHRLIKDGFLIQLVEEAKPKAEKKVAAPKPKKAE